MIKKCRFRKKYRIRKKISGSSVRPRLSFYKSLRSLYVQLIDDESGKTLLGLCVKGSTGIKTAEELGKKLAEEAKQKSIKQVSFDRNGYHYHGVVKAFAENARKNGLEF